MPVGATIAAVGSVAGAGIGVLGAKSAAKTQAAAANKASDVQLQMYGQTRSDLSPYRGAGADSLPAIYRLLGLSSGGGGAPAPAAGGGAGITGIAGGQPDWAAYGASNPDVAQEWNRIVQTGNGGAFGNDPNNYYQWHWENHGQNEPGRTAPVTAGQQANTGAATAAAGGMPSGTDIGAFLESLPGYKFARDQGIQSVTRALGSRGQTGAQAKGIARFVTGLADSTYGEQISRLMGLATLGENAAAQTGVIGAQTGNSVGNALIGAGQASAAGTVGATNAVTGGISNASNALLANRLLGSGMYSGGAGSATSYAASGASDMAGLF